MCVTKREGLYTGKMMHEYMNECVRNDVVLVCFVCVCLYISVCVCGGYPFVIANSLFQWGKKETTQAQQG